MSFGLCFLALVLIVLALALSPPKHRSVDFKCNDELDDLMKKLDAKETTNKHH